MLNIYIPSRGRADKQQTLAALTGNLRKHTSLVVPANELEQYRGLGVSVLTTPPSVRGIGSTRQWIMDNDRGRKLVMLDDDLVFAKRRKDDPTKFTPATTADIVAMFGAIEHHLGTYAHVGVATREGGNRFTTSQVNTRMLRVLAYDVKIFHQHKLSFTRLPVMEDFDVTLQLLRLGYANIVLAQWVHNQRGSGASGGCSTYRTMDMQAKAAKGLAKLHAPFVNVVYKQTSHAWGGQARQDVVIAWKKAYYTQRSQP